MSGGAPVQCRGRVRIKGKTASVMRFLMISMSYLLPWILLTSELGYFSKLYGPQVLLQLNLAFYMPSIPILIALGQLERWLDRRLGATTSMWVRLNVNILGCVLICAAYPFLPRTFESLMTVVIVLGVVHAIAFSTSYQLVSWFRQADTIALGIGCVGTGPAVLLIQLALGVGPHPADWQWIAMFEVAAGLALAGLLSSVSLFAQYWDVFEGTCGDASGGHRGPHELPLLEQDMQGLRQSQTLLLMAPDPFGGAPLMCPEDDFALFVSCMDLSPPRLIKRAATMPAVGSEDRIANLPDKSWHAAVAAKMSEPGVAAAGRYKAPAAPLTASSTPAAIGQGAAAATGHWVSGGPSPFDASAGDTTFDAAAASADKALLSSDDPAAAVTTPYTSSAAVAGAAAGAPAQWAVGALRGSAEAGGLTTGQEVGMVMETVWQVVLAFLCSVTVLYLIFPFFTYVVSSGLLGDRLPQALFFTRIFSDLLGRFLPRRKALLVKSPAVLLAIAGGQVLLATFFFVYLRAFPSLHHDVVFVAVVVCVWLAGGYINTCSNILAPNLVEARLAPRASAIMALTFQVAHFAGLLLAILMAYVLYGDVVGR